MNLLTNLCNLIYETGIWPSDLKQSIFIPLPKKAKTQECAEHRTISIMSHVTKVLLKVIQNRINAKIDYEVSQTQSGFRAGLGTREGIFNLRCICERSIYVQKDVFLCFIDYSKAFDNVKHTKLIECLQDIGVDDKDVRLISNLYWEQTASVKVNDKLTEEFKVKKGVRQGYVLSPCLFNLYTERIFKEVENLKGVSVGGINMNNLRYADDTVLIADSEGDLQTLFDRVNEKGEEYGMKMNTSKTKIMVVSKEETYLKQELLSMVNNWSRCLTWYI